MHYPVGRQGWIVGRDQVARVMKTRGITGVRRGRTTFRAIRKKADAHPVDKVNRQFVATRPWQLWVVNITYVAFVAEVFHRTIVGWCVSFTLKTDLLPLQALNLAGWQVSDNLTGYVHHPDRRSN